MKRRKKDEANAYGCAALHLAANFWSAEGEVKRRIPHVHDKHHAQACKLEGYPATRKRTKALAVNPGKKCPSVNYLGWNLGI